MIASPRLGIGDGGNEEGRIAILKIANLHSAHRDYKLRVQHSGMIPEFL